jgi:pantetheine-phosphate adenylyltransferase
MVNSSKGAGLLSCEERKALLALAAKGLDNVIVDSWDGWLVDYAKKVGATAVVKGIRDEKDLAWEMEMAAYNRNIDPELALETILLPAKEEFKDISSTLVRDCLQEGKSIENYVPAAVAGALQEKKGR